MAEFADWAEGKTANLSRFAVDGGILANTPTQPALRAIQGMLVDDKRVRRADILCLLWGG
ncbi:hypothetical protein ACQP1G_30575 [Nocardia sp. CA-107356]|uniref:hypothetical protein n=1 Tax=Nocardia sp. CA-107356 TaxID=3239972 RepID=UPI003D8BD45F